MFVIPRILWLLKYRSCLLNQPINLSKTDPYSQLGIRICETRHSLTLSLFFFFYSPAPDGQGSSESHWGFLFAWYHIFGMCVNPTRVRRYTIWASYFGATRSASSCRHHVLDLRIYHRYTWWRSIRGSVLVWSQAHSWVDPLYLV